MITSHQFKTMTNLVFCIGFNKHPNFKFLANPMYLQNPIIKPNCRMMSSNQFETMTNVVFLHSFIPPP